MKSATGYLQFLLQIQQNFFKDFNNFFFKIKSYVAVSFKKFDFASLLRN